MKYLTKKRYRKYLFSFISFSAYSSETYDQLYDLAFKKFLKLNEVDETDYDPIRYTKLFQAEIRYNSKLLRLLPKSIKEDKKILALGYASGKYIDTLKSFQKKLRKEYKRLETYNYIRTKPAFRNKHLHVRYYNEAIMEGIDIEPDRITIRLDEGAIYIANGKIIKGKRRKIYPYTDTYEPESVIMANELHRNRRGYELHLLMQNLNTAKPVDLFYLTIRGTDITEDNDFTLLDIFDNS